MTRAYVTQFAPLFEAGNAAEPQCADDAIPPLIHTKDLTYYCCGVDTSWNLLLVSYPGIVGAALTTLLAFSLAFTLTTIYAFRLFEFRADVSSILKSVFASFVASVLLVLWHQQDSYTHRVDRIWGRSFAFC